jgi:retron-type reverse transcriptase
MGAGLEPQIFANYDSRIEFEELLEAYFRCRKNKRRTHNALAFELDYEANLVTLWNEINDGTYRPGKSIAFIVNKPVKREIFAADFRDRIVHHLIISKLNPLFESAFIYDSYACRTGKGTLFGIRRLERFIRSASFKHTQDAYILKLDIRGFFMHINVEILYAKLIEFIHQLYEGPDKELLISLTNVVLFNNPSQNCVIKGARSGWDGLPHDKSLFNSPINCGLPIGNLSSQVFANFYLNGFDHFIKKDCGIKFYGRYVDDFVLVHQDGEYLRSLIPVIRSYLHQELGLVLHPKKIYLQKCDKGVAYLGAVIKPGRIYMGKRIKANFYDAIKKHNLRLEKLGEGKPDVLTRQSFQSSMNSYLGIMGHHNTYRLRKSMVSKNVKGWWSYAYINSRVTKFALRR